VADQERLWESALTEGSVRLVPRSFMESKASRVYRIHRRWSPDGFQFSLKVQRSRTKSCLKLDPASRSGLGTRAALSRRTGWPPAQSDRCGLVLSLRSEEVKSRVGLSPAATQYAGQSRRVPNPDRDARVQFQAGLVRDLWTSAELDPSGDHLLWIRYTRDAFDS